MFISNGRGILSSNNYRVVQNIYGSKQPRIIDNNNLIFIIVLK